MSASSATVAHAIELDYRPSYLAAAITALAVFILYLLTLSPTTAMWDTSEYIASAYVLGNPHPPGNPLFVLIGRVFSLLPIAGSVAKRINILAAVTSAASAGFWFLITERVLVGWLTERWQRIAGGALAAVIGATAFTVWNQSVVNEKVYTVSLLGLAAISWLTVRWSDDPDGPKADRTLILIGYLLGLGYSNHMMGFLAGPAATVAVLIRRPQTVLRWKLLVGIVGALLFGISVFAYQPIRAAHFPAINEGEPTACTTQISAACTFSGKTVDRFMYNFNRGQYGKPDLSQRQAPFIELVPSGPAWYQASLGGQVGMYWLYFKWQWLRDMNNEHGPLQMLLAMFYMILGLFGGYVHWKRDRRSFWYFGTFMLSLTVILIYYLNFKYGFSQLPQLGEDSVPREVRDRDYFFLVSFSAWGVWAALGFVFLWETLAAVIGSETVKLGREYVELPRRQSWIATSPVLALALIPLVGNWHAASRAGQTDTRDFAADLLNSVEPYGILVTVGDNDTFPLWYAQEVEGIRKDVIVANTSLLNTDWYTRQIIRRPTYEYDAAKGPAVYRGKAWPKPTKPALNMTFAQADALEQYMVLNAPRTFKKDSIVATIDPRSLEGGALMRADILVLRMILDAYPERPVYFSRTAAGYPRQLGLGNYMLTQGLARKLLPRVPSAAGRDTVMVAGEGWMDLQRTRTLWDSTFTGYKSIIRRGDWVDRASAGIPFLYAMAALGLAEAEQQNGDMQSAQRHMQIAEQVGKATGLGSLFGPSGPQPAIPLPPAGDTGSRVQFPAPGTPQAAPPQKQP